jgi:hypothetical protein
MFHKDNKKASKNASLAVGGTKAIKGTKETSKNGTGGRLDLSKGKYLKFSGNLCYIVDTQITYSGKRYKLKFLQKRNPDIEDGWFREDLLMRNKDISNVESFSF